MIGNGEGSSSGVPAGVEGEVVAAREPATAVGALEGLCAGVLPVVAGEFVGAGEAPLAPLPRARVRLLTYGEEVTDEIKIIMSIHIA